MAPNLPLGSDYINLGLRRRPYELAAIVTKGMASAENLVVTNTINVTVDLNDAALVLPCIDPDGEVDLCNWTLVRFKSLADYLFYVPAPYKEVQELVFPEMTNPCKEISSHRDYAGME